MMALLRLGVSVLKYMLGGFDGASLRTMGVSTTEASFGELEV